LNVPTFSRQPALEKAGSFEPATRSAGGINQQPVADRRAVVLATAGRPDEAAGGMVDANHVEP